MALPPLGAGLFLASQHPLWPAAATAAFIVWVIVAARVRGLWLLVLPAGLPVLNLSPWTGWLGFEEFDLLALGAIAGGFVSRLRRPSQLPPARSDPSSPPHIRPAFVLAVAFGGTSLLALSRGVADAGGWSFAWFDGYPQALNSIRLGKSILYALALWPVLHAEFQRFPLHAAERLARGMQFGLAIVSLAVLWERVAYPGLVDFSSRYRVIALFWEMHVGGGAIDAYLALATPFAVWSLWTARSRRGWAMAAFVALLAGHACLTTFSRGVYAGVAIPALVLGCVWWLRRSLASSGSAATFESGRVLAAAAVAALLPILAFAMFGDAGVGLVLAASGLLLILSLRLRSLRWRSAAALALALALVTEAVAVIGGGSFMRARLEASENDFGARLAHWRHGLDLLAGPTDWLFGIGLGRLPARYSRSIPSGEFSGEATLVPVDGDRLGVRLSGPATESELGGLYALTHRIAVHGGGAYRLTVKARAGIPTQVAVDLCEQHLLYTRRCQGKFIQVRASGGDWQRITASLDGPALSAGPWYAPRLGMLSLAVTEAGAAVELAEVRLSAPDGVELLENRDFSSGLAHWFPVAQYHFTPWHIDNLFLELLIERGALGLALFLALLACAFQRLLSLPSSPAQIAPFLAASLLGVLIVGCASSVLDVPRIAFLLFLLVFASLQIAPGRDMTMVRA